MAWYKRYRVPFQSIGGTQYMVYIYEQTSGDLVTLTGAAEPFMTQEEDNTDIFTPIRTQSGYIRVIDETNDGSLLESLIPSNNTQKLVQLYSGTWNNDMTIFTDVSINWQGFVCASAYTQQWDDQKKIIELPVKSLLAALEDVEIPNNNVSNETRFAALVVEAFNALGVTPTDVVWISNLQQPQQDMLHLFLQRSMFFDEVEINNENDVTKQIVGISYFDAISYAAQMFGICLREYRGLLSFGMYDKNGGRLYYNNVTWERFITYVANGSTIVMDPIELSEPNLLSSVTFVGSDNMAEFIQGKKEAIVTLDIKEAYSELMSLPITTEDTSTSYEIGNIYPNRGQVFVQPHGPRTNAIEEFHYMEYECTGYQPNPDNPLYAIIASGLANYDKCRNNSVIIRPDYKPLYDAQDHIYTGSFPCRWLYKKDANSQPQYQNGLFLNQLFLKENVQSNVLACYCIMSGVSHSLRDGYINIKITNNNFQRSNINGEDGYLTFGEFISQRENGKMATTYLYFTLRVGNYYWNGSYWTTTESSFEIIFYGSHIQSNKTTEMPVDETEGWFIPVLTPISGQVELDIMNISRCIYLYDDETTSNYFDTHSRIISELSVDFLQNIDPMASRRSKNTYRQQILNSGFSEAKETDLSIGTFNNNIPSPCFIKRDSTTYIESLTYYTSSSTESKRPELSLLSRMVTQYGQVRRAFTAVIRGSLSLIVNRYTYLSRYFFGVVKEHKWRDDIQEIKFIEVT